MKQQERWQLSGNAAELYEQQKVPALFRPLAELTLKHVPLYEGDRVLDLACGTGIVARLAAQRVGRSSKVVGIDLNAGMVEVARAYAPTNGVEIEWRQDDVSALSFPAASFDIALCQQGIQFFPDKLGALREIRRVLRPGGRLAFTVWSSVNPYNGALADALARHISAEVAARSLAPFAFRDAAVIRGLLTDVGFQAIDMQVVVVLRHMKPMEESLPQDIAGTPYAHEVAAADETVRAALVREVSTALQPFRDGDSVLIPTETHLVQAEAP